MTCGLEYFCCLCLTLFCSIGDFADLLVALSIMKTASKVDGGLPKTLYARMMVNALTDFGIGLIPFVGDLADAFYRANTRNAWLLDAYLSEKAAALETGKVEDPDSGKTVTVPGELRTAPPGGESGRARQADVEMGMAQVPLGNPQRGNGTQNR